MDEFKDNFAKKFTRCIAMAMLLFAGFIAGTLLFLTLDMKFGVSNQLYLWKVCRYRLHSIGSSIWRYQSHHADQYPPDLESLFHDDLIESRRILICPQSGTKMAAITPPTDLAVITDYIYTPEPVDDTQGELILVFELPINHKQQAAHVLYSNGSVHQMRDVEKLVAELQSLNDSLATCRMAK